MFALPLRLYWFQKNSAAIRSVESKEKAALYSLPWREFRADLFIWLLIGLVMAAFYLFIFRAPFLTGVKVLIGSISFGLFGGMLCFLSMEKRTMEYLKSIPGRAGISPKWNFSVSKKILFLTLSVLCFMVISILLMVFMDINYLLHHKGAPDPDIYFGVFKEILFAFSVLLVLSIVILGRYSRNLKTILSLQLGVMEEIGNGNYETQVPVVSNDEFGMIAAKTNEMITGLKEKDACQISFGQYVTPEVSTKILKGEVPQEGELRDVTILFCDLRGYTTLVEGRDPKEVVKLLNIYFSSMEHTIKEHKGIVLQYIGDEIEAVFGAPEDLPNHPEMAVKAALEMRRGLRELNEKRAAEGKDPIAHGIGIHTGKVLAGSVGAADRLVYAMVGDTVNSASRIQDLNKTYGTDILISEKTKESIRKSAIEMTSLGKVALRGKSKEMEIYKVL